MPIPRCVDMRLLLMAVGAGIMAAALLATRGFSSELRKDERLNWPAAMHFADAPVPTLEKLRAQPAPSGPLPYVVWGQLERLTGHGLVAGRLGNALLTLFVLAMVMYGGPKPRPGVLAGVGLLLCPYIIGVGVYLYTDAPTLFFLVLGLVAWARGRDWPAAAAMTLAIACRQYAVAIPAALALYELGRWARREGGGSRGAIGPWLAPLVTCATLLGWVALWGGLAPRGAVERWDIWTASIWRVVPRNGLYALTCVGAYFVVVETLLMWRRRLVRDVRSAWAVAGAVVLAVLFAAFPPLENTDYAIPTMGYLDRAARLVLSDPVRMVLFWLLAALALARLRTCALPLILVLVQALVMTKSQVGWDKYNLPVLAALWFLAARGWIDSPRGVPASTRGLRSSDASK